MTLPSFAVIELSISGANAHERALAIAVILLDSERQFERRWAAVVTHYDEDAPAGADSADLAFRDIAGQLMALLRGRLLVAHDLDYVCGVLRESFRRCGVKLPEGRFGFSLRELGYDDTEGGDYLDDGVALYDAGLAGQRGTSAVVRAAERVAAAWRDLGSHEVLDLGQAVPLVIAGGELLPSLSEDFCQCADAGLGGASFTHRDFAQIFPWFVGVADDVEAVVLQWISECAMLPLYKLSPLLNPMVLPEGFDTKSSHVQRLLNRFPTPLYATVADILRGQGFLRAEVEALVRALVLHAMYIGFAQQRPARYPHPLPALNVLAGWLDLHGAWLDYGDSAKLRGGLLPQLADAMAQHPSPARDIYERAAAEISRVIDQDPFHYAALLQQRAGELHTLQATATSLGLSRERTRQMEVRLGENIRKHGEFCELLASAMISRFHPCVRVDTVLQQMPLLAEPADARVDCTMFEVLCWLYSRHGVPNSRRAAVRWEVSEDWVICDDFVPTLNGLLKTLGNQFGIVKTETLLAQLKRRSKAIYSEEFLPYILQQCNYQQRDSMLIPREQSIVEMAGVELTLRGAPMTTKQLHDRMPHRTLASIVSALHSSQYFYRCAVDTWALRGWDFEEWTNLADVLARRVRKRGGEAPLDWLIDQATAFGVARSSVMTYLRGPEFVIGPRDMVRLSEEEPKCQQTPENSRGMYWGDAGWMQLITVTEEQLRGSGTVVQPAVVNLYELRFNRPTKIPSRLGPQAIRWRRSNCALGTLRRFLLELGSRPGDRVFLVFGHSFDVIAAPSVDLKLRGKRAVLNAMGLVERADESPFTTINRALGLPADARRTIAVERLIARGDTELAEKLRWA